MVLADGMTFTIEPEKVVNNGVDIYVRSWAVTVSHANGGSVRVVDKNLPSAFIRAQRGVIGTVLSPFKKLT
jgi:hypothetical protein